jgi:hypothetical protein
MKPLVVVGLILLVFSVLAFGYQGVTYVTTRDTVVKAGPVEVVADRDHAIPLAPIISGVALLAGVTLLIIGSGKSRVA